MLLQFTRYLHVEAGVPYIKAEIAARELHRYLINRQQDKLEYQEGMFEGVMRSAGKRRDPVKKFAAVTLPLCPDPERLDRFFAEGMGMLSLRRFAFFAFIELTPLWVRFLVTQGLLAADAAEAALHSLKKVAEDMRPVIRQEIEPAQVLRH